MLRFCLYVGLVVSAAYVYVQLDHQPAAALSEFGQEACLYLPHCSYAVRIGLNGRVAPKTRDGIFIGAVFTALIHAGYVMSGDSSMGAGN